MTRALTAVALAEKVQRYWELTRLVAEARRTAAGLHDELVAAIIVTGEPIDVEGLPTLRLVDRRSGRIWDVKALAQHEPREFQRLLELGCLSVLDKVAEAQLRAGNLSGIHRQFSWETHSQALMFDFRRRPSRKPADGEPQADVRRQRNSDLERHGVLGPPDHDRASPRRPLLRDGEGNAPETSVDITVDSAPP